MNPNDAQSPTPVNDARPRLTGVTFVSAYVDDYAKAYEFYSDVLGLEKQYDMGDLACFLKLTDDVGLYLQGGNARAADDSPSGTHASFGLTASSVGAFWDRLRAAGARTVQQEPMEMGGGWYWFQVYDPAGNLIEIVGEK